ncbi:hypothetical protein [Leifsonia sp. P73]|uniref:hypothetical protein n=1 Tax=Leifsonia sp. P73 TaxID=3423959 RepID=UPI003DA565DA
MNTRTTHFLRLAGAAALGGALILTLGASAAATPAQTDGSGGPHFYSGVAVDVSGPVNGDVYAAGQSVTVSGDVTGDVIAAAQTITISGRVDGNVRLAGQDVTITGQVARSGTIFASDLLVATGGSVQNDIVATATSIRVAGDVGRDLLVSVTDLRIDGTVGGDVTYASATTARIADGAVAGSVEHVQTQQSSAPQISPWAAVLGWFLGLVYALVALSLLTVAAGLLVPRTLVRVTDRLLPSPWRALLVGFVAAVVVPIGLLLLLVTIAGAPLALAGLLVWIVLTLATFLVGAHYLGRVVLRTSPHPVLQSFVGGLILIVGLQIPVLNILVWLAMVFFGLGAELLELYRQRPWKVDALTPAAPPVPAAPQEAQPVAASDPPRQ